MIFVIGEAFVNLRASNIGKTVRDGIDCFAVLQKADHVVNYKKDDYMKVVQDVTCGKGVDVCFDPVWGTTAAKTQEALGQRSRWIVLGMVGGTQG